MQRIPQTQIPYEIIGEHEASIDSICDEITSFNFSSQYEKIKKNSMSIATFSIFMVSFNITTPLTISVGASSLSVGNLKIFFILLIIYQIYLLKCLIDEFLLSSENYTSPLKQKYCWNLLFFRANKLFIQNEGIYSAGEKFQMHGFNDIHNNKSYTKPSIIHIFKDDEELQNWEAKLGAQFSFLKQNNSNDKWYVYLTDSMLSKNDLKYWKINKKRIYTKLKAVQNHYHIPLIYSVIGIVTTIFMISSSLREFILSFFII